MSITVVCPEINAISFIAWHKKKKFISKGILKTLKELNQCLGSNLEMSLKFYSIFGFISDQL